MSQHAAGSTSGVSELRPWFRHYDLLVPLHTGRVDRLLQGPPHALQGSIRGQVPHRIAQKHDRKNPPASAERKRESQGERGSAAWGETRVSPFVPRKENRTWFIILRTYTKQFERKLYSQKTKKPLQSHPSASRRQLRTARAFSGRFGLPLNPTQILDQ